MIRSLGLHEAESIIAERGEIFFRGLELSNGYREEWRPEVARERWLRYNEIRALRPVAPHTIDEDLLQKLPYMQGVAGIALVPLCPHSLTNRPILVSDQNEIEVRLIRAPDSRVYFDGQVTFDMQVGDTLHIRRSVHSISMLHPPGYSYFAMLRKKLHWSEQPKVR